MPGSLTVVGAGLIGGSFALAARQAFAEVIAVDADPDIGREAVALGLADRAEPEVPPDADAVLLACPADRIAEWVVRLAGHPGTVFDAGSVKGAVLEAVVAALGRLPENFVPSHPIAGREQSGPQAADAALFQGRAVVVTPVTETSADRLAQVIGWWEATGARVVHMDPTTHDRVYAATSHLPHLLAFAYLQNLGDEHRSHTGGGFRDFSRIGGSDPRMWSAIFDLNRDALLATLDDFEQALDDVRASIRDGDLAAVQAFINRARDVRQRLSGADD